MKKKKSTYNPKSRKDISNPNHSLSHKKLLNIANLKKFDCQIKIIKLENGRIFVKESEE